MIGLVRTVAALKAVEPRHWFGLGASVLLHLGVLLGWKPEPPPEPKPISFEIALEPTAAEPLPVVKTKAAAKKSPPKKLAKQRKAKPVKMAAKHKTKQEIAKREPNFIDATWQGEAQATRQDAPALALPDSRALGLTATSQAATQEIAKAGGKPQLTRTAPDARDAAAGANVTSVAANESSASLSEPGVARASADSAPRGESGLALAQATALSTNQGLNPGTEGAGAQASTSTASLAGASSLAGERQGSLQASASPQAALNAPLGAGIQAAVTAATATTSLAAASGAEPQGVRLTASSALGGSAALPVGTGSTAAGPPAAASVKAVQTAPSQSAGGASGGVLASSQAGAAVNPIKLGGRSATTPQAGLVTTATSRGGRGQEAKGGLGVAVAAPTALVGAARTARVPGSAGQGGETVALAPGEPGSSPYFAVAMQPVVAGVSSARSSRAVRPGQAGGGTSGEPAAGIGRAVPSAATDTGTRGGASQPLAGSASGGGLAATSGRAASLAGGGGGGVAAAGQAASAAVLNAAGEAGRAPVVLHATHVVPVKVVRPDTEIQRLDVLAPSNYCPLPIPGHSQPINRAPQPDRNIAEQPAYALDNPPINYPVWANIQGVEGQVTLRVEVLANGRPDKMWLKQSSGSSLLDQDALEQLKHWRFMPARKNGQPVSAWIDVPVLYRSTTARH